MREREKLGKPEEESAASSSTQSAAGLGGGTPEGHPARGRDMEREERGRDRVGEQRPPAPDERSEDESADNIDRGGGRGPGRTDPTLPAGDSPLRTEI